MNEPWFSTDTVAKVFLGRSSAWLRKHMRNLDRYGFPDITRSDKGDRRFSLEEIEKLARALRAADAINDERLAVATEIIALVRRQYTRTYSTSPAARWARSPRGRAWRAARRHQEAS
jgi:hypothetical protein